MPEARFPVNLLGRYTGNVRSLSAILVLALPFLGWGQGEVALAPGDKVLVTTAGLPQYSGEFLVMLDGTVTLGQYGAFVASGKTAKQLESEVVRAAKRLIRDPHVTVGASVQAPRKVYILSSKASENAFEWQPGLGVRAALNRVPLGPLDELEVRVYRSGTLVATVDLRQLLKDSQGTADVPLVPGDILWVADVATVFAMVEGSVARPGPVRIRPGDSVSSAIARAGGLNEASLTAFTPEEISVTVRRGADEFVFALSEILGGAGGAVADGDRIVVEKPAQIRVTVGGNVNQPGARALRAGTSVAEAIEQFGGPRATGTLRQVFVFRGSEVLRFDLVALAREGKPAPALQDSDFVTVPTNERAVYVFGFVKNPGKKPLPDQLEPRLADALDLGGGLELRGTLRRAVVLRPDTDGRFVATLYNLDAFLKDGDASQNPTLDPGDVVFFDQSRGTNLGEILRVLPGLLLVERLFN